MKKRFSYLILPFITLILELLPYGAVCNFMRPSTTQGIPSGRFRELYSYFDLTPFGYANFAPLVTAIMTCFVLLILVIYCFIGKKFLVKAAKNMIGVSAVTSFGPLALGPHFLSVVGILISASLIVEFILLFRFTKASD